MIDPRSVGVRIAERRRQNRLTQRELAQKLSICPQAVSKWERGRALPDLTYIDELASQLGCTIDELLTGVCQKNEKTG